MKSKIKYTVVVVGMIPLYLIKEMIHVYGYHYANPYRLPYGKDPLKSLLQEYIEEMKSCF